MTRSENHVDVLRPWADAVRLASAGCYWPGPWSIIGEGRQDQLIGRESEADDIAYAVLDHNLVVLSGASGVGKTSLLHQKVLPELAARGLVVVMSRDWADAPVVDEDDKDAVALFLRRMLSPTLAAHGLPTNGDALETLDDAFGGRAVLVLDQFEEVIRQRPAFFALLQDWIETVVDRYEVRIVLSLRSEYNHRVAELRVNPYRRKDIEVQPLNDVEVVEKIVRAGRRPGAENVVVVADDAVAALLRLWERSGATRRSGRIRLLHLQAVLFMLWERAHEHGDGVVTARVVDNLEDRARRWTRETRRRRRGQQANAANRRSAEATHEQAIALFDFAIVEVVKYYLGRCERALDDAMKRAFTERGVDDFLSEGVRSVLVRMAEHLSSGGYKVDQDHVHLAELVLREELETLGFLVDVPDDAQVDPEERARAIIKAVAAQVASGVPLRDGNDVFDWVSAPGRLLRDAVRAHIAADFPEEWVADTDGVTAGPLMGHSPEAVLVEECRRYFLALEWLESGELLRLSSTDEGSSIVTLTHDGFGRGLNDWADANDADPDTHVHRITAAVGAVFQWRDAAMETSSRNPFVSAGNRRANKRHMNLRWRACRVVGVRMERVVFINCDFSGTEFERCTFEGVTFVNCVLNGVQFDHCVFVGTTETLEDERREGRAGEDRLPSFVDDRAEDVRLLERYIDTALVGANVVYSQGPGVPAVPAIGTRRRDDQTAATQLAVRLSEDSEPLTATSTVDDQDGGLVMFGGRLSSIAFYACSFAEQGELSFRHVRGTSIDFFEHTGGRVEMYDVYLRGITFTTPVAERRLGGQAKSLGFQALDSHLENVWFSTWLEGEAEFQRTSVWQIFNGSAEGHAKLVIRTNDEVVTEFTGRIDAGDGNLSVEDIHRYADVIDFQPAGSASPVPPAN